MKTKLSRRMFIASAAVSVIPTVVASARPATGGLLSIFAVDREATKGTDSGVIDLSRSPFAKLKTVPVGAVVIKDGFWSQRRKINLAASIPSMHDELLAHEQFPATGW